MTPEERDFRAALMDGTYQSQHWETAKKIAALAHECFEEILREETRRRILEWEGIWLWD